MWRIAFVLMAAALTSAAQAADWYETRGWAPIINGNVEAARERAVENALRQGLDLAGGSVQSVEEVVDGVITGQRMQWRSNGAIEHAELVRERTNKQRHEVTLRTLIRPNVSACGNSQYKPAVVLAPFEVAFPEHLRHGDIQTIGATSSFRFSRLLGQHSQSLRVAQLLSAPQGVSRFVNANQNVELAEFTRRVAREYNSQYIIAGIFHDLSATPVDGPNLLFWRHPAHNRQFELSLYLLDGYSGELLTTASVSGLTAWPYPYNAQVDTSSDAFWRNEFGQQLESRMRDLVYGFDQKLQCQGLKGLVLRTDNEQIYTNLGERNLIMPGTKAQLLHRGGFLDELGQYREQWVVNPAELVVTQVYGSSSVLQVSNGEPLIGVQQRDIILIK